MEITEADEQFIPREGETPLDVEHRALQILQMKRAEYQRGEETMGVVDMYERAYLACRKTRKMKD